MRAVVVERGGDTHEGDDVRGGLVGLGGLAAVVLERPGAGLGGSRLLVGASAAARRVLVPAGGEHGTEAECATGGEDATAGEVSGSGVGHVFGYFRTGRSAARG